MVQKKIKTLEELLVLIPGLEAKGVKIVFKSGVFDLLHPGHVRAIKKSKEAGDILIIGVHGDEMTRLRKGPPKPIYTQEDRMEVLSHISEIDFLLPIGSQEELYDGIERICPATLAISETSTQGSENAPATMRERFGKMMNILVLSEQWEFHVTDILTRIKNS